MLIKHTERAHQPLRMVHIKSIYVHRVRVRDIKLGSRAVRDANFPQGRAISGRLEDKVTHFKINTCNTNCFTAQISYRGTKEEV